MHRIKEKHTHATYYAKAGPAGKSESTHRYMLAKEYSKATLAGKTKNTHTCLQKNIGKATLAGKSEKQAVLAKRFRVI